MRPHGVRGDLLVEPYSETIHSIDSGTEVYFGVDLDLRVVKALRMHRRQMLLSLQDCESREQADLLRGEDLFIKLDEAEPLPAGVYYRWEILGLEVVEAGGRHLGRISDILETGANDVYVVTSKLTNAEEQASNKASELLLPAIEDVILEVDLVAGTMTVRLPEGLE